MQKDEVEDKPMSHSGIIFYGMADYNPLNNIISQKRNLLLCRSIRRRTRRISGSYNHRRSKQTDERNSQSRPEQGKKACDSFPRHL